jgi:hypothetical protein
MEYSLVATEGIINYKWAIAIPVTVYCSALIASIAHEFAAYQHRTAAR